MNSGDYEYLDVCAAASARLIASGVEPGSMELHFGIADAWTDYISHKPTYRERQEWHNFRNRARAPKPAAPLNADDLAYLLEKLAFVNDPQGVRIRDKIFALLV